MNMQKMLVSGIAGGIISFLGGYLVYGIALMDFFADNAGPGGKVAMLAEADMIWWSLVVGCIVTGLVYSYVFNRWANINSFGAGLSAGAVLGLLMIAAFDFGLYATTSLYTLKSIIVDILAGTVLAALVGGTVGLVNGLQTKKTA